MNKSILRKIRKELIINLWMLIKSIIKAGMRRFIIVILQPGRSEYVIYYVV